MGGAITTSLRKSAAPRDDGGPRAARADPSGRIATPRRAGFAMTIKGHRMSEKKQAVRSPRHCARARLLVMTGGQGPLVLTLRVNS
jgi:hypothetical protein